MSDDDAYSLPNRIVRAEQRIARQRQIVEELARFNSAESAQGLLNLMEETLASLRDNAARGRAPARGRARRLLAFHRSRPAFLRRHFHAGFRVARAVSSPDVRA